jgi:hypothetical protein
MEAAAKLEQERLEAEAERERLKQAAEREFLRLEAEAVAERARLAAAAAERERLEAEVEYEVNLDQDPFADFRPESEESRQSLLRAMPVSQWAKREETRQLASEIAQDEVHNLIEGLALPPHVAGVTYARGCRIRRVRVPAARPAPRSRNAKTVIVSKRALEEARAENRSGR